MKLVQIILLITFICSCSPQRVERNSDRMANSTERMQENTQRQIDQMLIYIDQLNQNMNSMNQTFEILVGIMNNLDMSLQELAKLSPGLMKLLDSTNTLLEQGLLQTEETEDEDTMDLDDILGDENV